MPKSICIKSNNNEILSYLSNELEHFNIDNTYFYDYNTLNPNDKIIAPIGVSYVMLVKR